MDARKLHIEELPSAKFQPLRYGLGAWTEHIFFAFDLVAILKPAVLVELGTDRGESYFAFCQSALENQTGTRCFAIDHWRGDTHSGSYDETTFADVAAHNDANYAKFSTLIRSAFDEARDRFSTETVDLLHIDGHHTEDAVRHDLESWLPKVRPGGIVLLHDIAVRRRDFGVWKVWAELTTRGRFWSFPDLPGLGVWEKPPAKKQPELLQTLFDPPNESQRELLSYYQRRRAELEERIAHQWRDGTIRSTPMANETVIQVFWTDDCNYRPERAIDLRIGHNDWKNVVVGLPADELVSGLRIDFYSALTTIEIESIEVRDSAGRPVYLANIPDAFDAISLLGDCVRRSRDPFVVEVTGVDPQLHLPPFGNREGGLTIRLRLRVKTITTDPS